MPAPPSHSLALERVYAPTSPGDGRRVLVERLWPRGLRKEAAGVDLWLKEVAPSHALRRWFHEAPEARWPGFRDRYREELRGGAAAAALAELRGLARRGPVTLLFAARDEARNSAAVLKAVLEEEEEPG
jgi:uncharacterized protein YeaO (DUF488 family)